MRSKYEIKAHKELEADGWTVDYKMRPRFASSKYNTDYFNLFDLLAHKEGMVRWISIKGHGGVPKKHKQALENFKMGDANVKEIWVMTRPKNVWRKLIIE